MHKHIVRCLELVRLFVCITSLIEMNEIHSLKYNFYKKYWSEFSKFVFVNGLKINIYPLLPYILKFNTVEGIQSSALIQFRIKV